MSIDPTKTFPAVRARDAELADLLVAEERRQSTALSLIASENHSSRAIREACSSVLSDKYAEGYPGARYYGGCEVADQVENVARSRAMELFGAEHANVQPHSGTTANLTTFDALAGAGGRILGMKLADGGHLSHGYKVSATGRLFEATHYGVDPETGLLRYDEIRRLAKETRPHVIIAGASSYPRSIDYAAFADIARESESRLVADIAHPAGLIAAGLLESPVGLADAVTLTTHKTLRGPRGGMILCKQELAKTIDSAVFPGGQGGPLMQQIAAKAIAFGEALHPDFRRYQEAVLGNARRLAEQLAELGFSIVTGGTDTHMVVVDLRDADVTGAEIEDRCFHAGIVLNKNMVPNDPRSPRVTSGIRVGTAAITTRGMGIDEIDRIARVIADIIRGGDPAGYRREVSELCAAYPL